MVKFEKPAISIPDQIALLRRRGLIIDNVAQAKCCLSLISYYRLRPYWLPFEVPTQPGGDHAFREHFTFEDVLAVYRFDRCLRLLVWDGIERVEVALRAQWAHHMAITHGPHGYLRECLYFHKKHHKDDVAKLTRQFQRSNDTFASHYRTRYTDPKLPPVWVAAEMMSLGQLSRWISNLKQRKDRQAIAKLFALDERVFTSFCHHMSHIRNICAHQGRLWNKRFIITIKVPQHPINLTQAFHGPESRRLHNTLIILDHILTIIAPEIEWRKRILQLINSCPLVNPVSMGFPTNWRELPAWQVSRAD